MIRPRCIDECSISRVFVKNSRGVCNEFNKRGKARGKERTKVERSRTERKRRTLEGNTRIEIKHQNRISHVRAGRPGHHMRYMQQLKL